MVDLFNNPDSLVLWGGAIAVLNPILITLMPKPPIQTKVFGLDIRWIGAIVGAGLAGYGLMQGGKIPFISQSAYTDRSYQANIRKLAYYSAAHRTI